MFGVHLLIVHLLIMDLHRALNQLEAESAVETVAGASVHHIKAGYLGAVWYGTDRQDKERGY